MRTANGIARCARCGLPLALALAAFGVSSARSNAAEEFRQAMASPVMCSNSCIECGGGGPPKYERYLGPYFNDGQGELHGCGYYMACDGCGEEASAAVPTIAAAVDSHNALLLRDAIERIKDKVEVNYTRRTIQVMDCGKQLVVASLPVDETSLLLASNILRSREGVVSAASN